MLVDITSGSRDMLVQEAMQTSLPSVGLPSMCPVRPNRFIVSILPYANLMDSSDWKINWKAECPNFC